ncbi:Zn-ribbon domain-containing OB-fold protein [Myxococcota bacterium]|nr:Zn-ribbon domain-containing OB-fold protein [Myxococcota bacterium]
MSDVKSVERPAPPQGSRDSAFFWEGVGREVLLGQQCTGCKRFRHPPRPLCPHCRSFEWKAVELSGRGTVHSWVKPIHPPLPMFPEGYLVALIDLEEGIRLLSNLCEIEPDDVENGMSVEVFFAPTRDGGRIHQFRPTQEARRG